MSDIGEVLTAAMVLVVGGGVIAVMAGANATVVSDLMASGITLIVYVAVIAIFALVLINLVKDI
ncbi:hypothetical protein [Natronorubrum sp. FCH18a]|uniref:hypothetical protein n=1 Tax=Natronorubrum sp. FCH18a TaxID=3447018 RepID=UPI003F512F3D